MISKGKSSVSLEEILNLVTEADIISYYLGVTEIPTVINSPLRQDNKPSLGLYSVDGKRIFYTDFSTRDRGGLFDLLCHMWGIPYKDVLTRVYNDIKHFPKYAPSINRLRNCSIQKSSQHNIGSKLKVRIREWRDYDIEYWESYGVTLKWLKYAEVYPISHKIIIKNGKKYTFKADKLAYVYVERKEGNITLKVYQPYNKNGYKWSSKHDRSVISLWTKIPEYGDKVIICSSLKDALCIANNLGIPTLAIQGEAYKISETAINELKRRYRKVYISLDTDEAGLKDGEQLSLETGFINIVPDLGIYKDYSDYFHALPDKKEFLKLKSLFN